ncbi:MAG TPA: hypothetical protein VEA36_00160 [Candidatus Paceibacterota bacterium]|nr:hypothetical protein [Candidatus Paceibacterota bacterium]
MNIAVRALAFVLVFSLLIPVHASAMVTPILAENTSSATLSSTLERWIPLSANGGNARSASDTNRQVFPISGTLKNLRVHIGDALSAGTSYTITVYKNGVATGLTCTVTDAALTCNDLVNTVSIAAGDFASVRILPTNSPVGSDELRIGVAFEGGTPGETFILGWGSGANATINSYASPGWATSFTTPEFSRASVFPTSGTIDNLHVYLRSTAPGAGRSWTWYLRKGTSINTMATTSLTCQIADTATTCTDPTNSVSVSAGDVLSFVAVPSGTPSNTTHSYSFRFRPTIDGESVMMAHTNNSLSVGVTRYIPTGGLVLNGAQGTNATGTMAVAPVPFTWRKLYTDFNTAPGGVTSRTISANLNEVVQSLSCAVSGTNTTCNDLNNSISVAAGDLITWQSTTSGSPAASANIRVSGVMFIDPSTVTYGQPRFFNLGTMLLRAGTLIFR